MSRDLKDLQPEFRLKVNLLLRSCYLEGVIMKPFYTLRTPWEQARLWRSTRSTEYIRDRIRWLIEQGAVYLADTVESVGPQPGPIGEQHVTNALPGLSWHQWGLAVDCYWDIDGKAIWSPTYSVGNPPINGYRKYGEHAKSIGLTSGGLEWDWDWPHVQMHAASSPTSIYPLHIVNNMMCDQHGETEVS